MGDGHGRVAGRAGGVGEVVGHDLTVCRVARRGVDHPPLTRPTVLRGRASQQRTVDEPRRLADGAPGRAYARGMSAADSGRPTLAVTGSTGWLGGLVARDLAGRGVAQRLLVRDVARAPELPGSVAARCSYRDADCRPRGARGRRDPLHGLGRRERRPAGRAPRLRRRGGGRRGGSRRLRLLLRRRSRCDVHARPRPRRHRGAPPRVRHGVDLPARQPLPRVHGPHGRGRRGHPRARRPTVGPRSSRTTTSPGSPSRCCSTRRRTRARPTT